MQGETKQAGSATMAIFYITAGALLDVWVTVYWVYLWRNPSEDGSYYWCAGLFFTGLVLIGIGLLVGRIGRSARAAEVTSARPVQMITPGAPVSQPIPANSLPVSPPVAQQPMSPPVAQQPMSPPVAQQPMSPPVAQQPVSPPIAQPTMSAARLEREPILP